MTASRVTAVVLAYQDEPWLRNCVANLLASRDVEVDVVLVDNGCTSGELSEVAALEGVHLLSPPRNLGFAGGCNAGAREASGDVLVFVNSDCVVAAGALAALAHELSVAEGLVTASVRLGGQPHLLNAAGNPVHFLGFSWAGGLGEPAPYTEVTMEVASVSGACFAITRRLWEELGGFPDAYFAYHEDVELSLRCWLSGRTVRCVPAAVAHHHYEFSRHPDKMYLLERNRLLTWLTVLQPRTLLLLLPALLICEMALAVVAARQGWLRQKLRGWCWIFAHRSWVRQRRIEIVRGRRRPDGALALVLSGKLAPGGSAMPASAAWANLPLHAYWVVVRRWL